MIYSVAAQDFKSLESRVNKMPPKLEFFCDTNDFFEN